MKMKQRFFAVTYINRKGEMKKTVAMCGPYEGNYENLMRLYDDKGRKIIYITETDSFEESKKINEQEGEKEMKQTKKGVKRNMGMTFENTGETVETQSVRVKGLSRNNIKRLEKKEKAAHWERNEEHKGIEISFKERPNKAVREMLKAAGFRWHNAKQMWYAKETDARVEIANMVCA